MVGLKRFLYLDEDAINDYIGALEGGIRGSRSTRVTSSREGEAGVDLKVLRGGGKKASEREEEIVYADTPQARFDRLEQLAIADEEFSGWTRILNPENDLKDLPTGNIVDIDCEIYIPEFLRTMSQIGDFAALGDLMSAVAPYADVFEINNMPDPKLVAAAQSMGKFSGMFEKFVVVVGETESDWQLVGPVNPKFKRGELEGEVRLVGKVKKSWPEGQTMPILDLAASFLSRKDRRKRAKADPKEVSEDKRIDGPAVLLDLLAIYT